MTRWALRDVPPPLDGWTVAAGADSGLPTRICAEHLEVLGARREPGELRVPDEAGRGVEEHEGRGTLWIRRCEEDAQRAGVTEAKDHGSLGLGGVHDGANVVHSTLERGHTRDAIGHAHSAQVEQDETRGRSESAIELCDGEALPVELEVGYRRSEDQVRWTIA